MVRLLICALPDALYFVRAGAYACCAAHAVHAALAAHLYCVRTHILRNGGVARARHTFASSPPPFHHLHSLTLSHSHSSPFPPFLFYLLLYNMVRWTAGQAGRWRRRREEEKGGGEGGGWRTGEGRTEMDLLVLILFSSGRGCRRIMCM